LHSGVSGIGEEATMPPPVKGRKRKSRLLKIGVLGAASESALFAKKGAPFHQKGQGRVQKKTAVRKGSAGGNDNDVKQAGAGVSKTAPPRKRRTAAHTPGHFQLGSTRKGPRGQREGTH